MAVNAFPGNLTPAFLDDVLAKSAEKGGDTLAQHTWAVVSRLADQYRLRPELAKQLGDDRLWHRLYWGCFLHDFGKAALGFQERLRQPKVSNAWSEGRQRHEVLSLAFADAAFPSKHPDRLPVIAVIIAHHKDFDGERADSIIHKYGGRKPDPQQEARVQFLIDQLNPELIRRLWRWFNEYGVPWSQALGFDQNDVFPSAVIEKPLTAENIRNALRDFSAYHLKRKDGDITISEIARDMHYRGLILTADHAASAGAPPFPPMRLTMEIASKPLEKNKQTPNPHQIQAANSLEGSAILTAPTGSGKTEAALMWAARQIQLRPAPRLFYTLPYQASMNAMADRLCDAFFGVELTNLVENQDITIQHSRATLKFYQDAMDSDSGAAEAPGASQRAREQTDKTRLNYYPIQVFSPYQMLKAAYQLKGYETLLVDYTERAVHL